MRQKQALVLIYHLVCVPRWVTWEPKAISIHNSTCFAKSGADTWSHTWNQSSLTTSPDTWSPLQVTTYDSICRSLTATRKYWSIKRDKLLSFSGMAGARQKQIKNGTCSNFLGKNSWGTIWSVIVRIERSELDNSRRGIRSWVRIQGVSEQQEERNRAGGTDNK